ncbi:MAG: galactose-1-phosphate uridylyltransferase [Nakamurella sp.]
MWRSVTTLADGRELIYFDESPGQDRTAPDERDLPTVELHSEARFDALAREWVAIAGHRQTRTYRPPADQCPLCPSTTANASEIPSVDYDVAVFENRFPSFAGVGPHAEQTELFETHQANGRCEVVCFTSDHRATMSSLPDARIRTVVDVWTDRTRALAEHPGVEQVFCFENRGVEIGVTLDHPHGQIYGYPFITPVTARMLESIAAHRASHSTNLFADLLINEIGGPRVIASNDHWVAFVPFAARWPIEVHIYPRRQVADLPALTDDERDAFVPIYREALRRMEGLFDEPLPLITAWHQAPVRTGRTDWWMHLRLTSIRRAPHKIKYLAGSESAMGAFINDTAPEQVAARLREVSV